MKYNLFDNFDEIIEVVYILPGIMQKRAKKVRLLIERIVSPFCSRFEAVFLFLKTFFPSFRITMEYRRYTFPDPDIILPLEVGQRCPDRPFGSVEAATVQ